MPGKATDIALVIDHLAVECGVRFRYSELLKRCNAYGLRTALVSDNGLPGLSERLSNSLLLKVEDEKEGVRFKRRPFVSLTTHSDGEETVDPDAFCGYHGLNREQALWLDAWKYSSEWIHPTVDKINSFMKQVKPRQTVVATQSFLGFAATRLGLPGASVSFHTNYGAFYASRLSANNPEVFQSLKRAINNRIAREFFPRFTRGFVSSFAAVSEYEESEFRIKDINEFPGGVDTEIFRPAMAKKQGKKINVLFAGRLTEEKGTDLLMQAAAKMKEVDWTIIGTGFQKSMLERSIPGACFLGTLSQKEVSEAMNRCDIFIFLGKWDTFGLSALEAMACGVPVISVEGSGISNRILASKSGIVIPYDSSALVRAITLLAECPSLRQEMGENGRNLAENLNWEQVCDGFLNKLGFHFPKRKRSFARGGLL